MAVIKFVCITLFLVISCISFAADSLQQNKSAPATVTVNSYSNNDNWKWGIFYYNIEDKRMFPPKRNGLGWTINFAHPLAIVIVLGGIAIVAAGSIYYKKRLASKQKNTG